MMGRMPADSFDEEELTSKEFDALLAAGHPADLRVSPKLTAVMAEEDTPVYLDEERLREHFAGVEGAALRAAVHEARAVGHTWTSIGEALGISGPAAFERFGLEEYLKAHPNMSDDDDSMFEPPPQADRGGLPDVSLRIDLTFAELTALQDRADVVSVSLQEYLRWMLAEHLNPESAPSNAAVTAWRAFVDEIATGLDVSPSVRVLGLGVPEVQRAALRQICDVAPSLNIFARAHHREPSEAEFEAIVARISEKNF